MAHQHVRSNMRLDERDGVRFEEAQTPAHGQNTYLREVTPDGLLLPDEATQLASTVPSVFGDRPGRAFASLGQPRHSIEVHEVTQVK